MIKAKSKMYWSLLGATRFFLAAIVAVAHLTWSLETPQRILILAKFSGLASILGFLLISGYSIANSFAQKPHGFYLRRLVRIIPLYFFCTMFSAILPIFFGNPASVPGRQFTTPHVIDLVGNLLFLQGFFFKPINTNPVVWTLSIEVFFYILTPLLAKKNSIFVLMLSGLSAFCFVLYGFINLPYYSSLLYGLNVVFLGWAWLLGFWYFYNQSKPWSLFLIFAMGTCAIELNSKYLELLWPITWMLTCLIIGYGDLFRKQNFSNVLNIAGRASYPLYLIHIPIYLLAYQIRLPNIGILYFIFAVFFSILLDIFVDKPLNLVIKKYCQRNN